MKRTSHAGASLLALSRTLAPVIVVGAIAMSVSPSQAQSVCAPNLLGIIDCTGTPLVQLPTPTSIGPLNIPASLTPVQVVLDNGFQSPGTTAVSTVVPGADVVISSLGTAAINTVDQPALLLNSAGGLDANVTTIATAGDGAIGAVLRAADDVVFVADAAVSTLGANAPAIDAQGGSVSIATDTISTVGDNANGAVLQSLNGPVELTANLITTNGNLSDGALIRAAGSTVLQGGAIRVGGTDALAFNISNDAAACALLGAGGCTNTVNLGEVTTNGFGGVGGLVTAAGSTDINIGVLRTGGDQAAGLNLSTDPTACVVLGVGGCGTAFTVQNLTTQGATSPGALVSAGGPIVANVGVLQTNGVQAIGLDLASQPQVCAVVGAGNCGASFNVGQLLTNGAGATGVLARIAGPTTGNVGVLRTNGDNAAGIDIASDPVVCAIVGTGACDVSLVGQSVTTTGSGAAGVLINAAGNVTSNIGNIVTTGANSPGLTIIANPAVCLILGTGACGITSTTGPVNTGGNNSPGTGVTGTGGPTTVMTGPTTTSGNGSPGVTVTNPGPTTVTTGPVTTTGNNSPGVNVDGSGGNGPVTVTTGPVTTSGTNSPGVIVDGGGGTTTVSTGPVTTTGGGSNGVDVTGAGPITFTTTGPVTTTGPNSNGVVVTGTGCNNVNITATGSINSAQGTGILASSVCTLTITTLPGAPVRGATAGIDATSGTGTTITIGDVVASTNGPAIIARGAPAVVTITPTGSLTGYVTLTGGNDTLTNNGVFNATANSDFGAGTDTLVNNGTFAVRPAATTPGAVTLTGLETFINRGTLDLRNGHTGDVLTIPGSFTGSGASTLGIDVAITPAGPLGDRLVIGGAATGSTAIAVQQTTPGVLINNLVVVDAGAGSSPGAFVAGPVSGAGLVGYNVAFNPTTNDYSLFATPNVFAYQLAGLPDGARQLYYRTSDTVFDHLQSTRDARGTIAQTPGRSSALWGQMFGSVDRRTLGRTVTAFGQSQSIRLDNTQDFFGAQIGYDFGSVTDRDGFVFGITGGYASSNVSFRNTPDRLRYEAINGGAYASFNSGPFFLNGLGKYEHYWLQIVEPSAGFRGRLHGDGYGGRAEAGIRLGDEGFFAEPAVSIEYVHTDFGTLNAASTALDFGGGEGLRGKAGGRLGVRNTSATRTLTFYVGGNYIHEFRGNDDTAFISGGQRVDLLGRRLGDYGRGTLGINIVSGGRVSGFIEGYGDVSSHYKGGGGRGGLSVRF